MESSFIVKVEVQTLFALCILLAPEASEASMGAFYFRERVNGCCNGAAEGACILAEMGYCY